VIDAVANLPATMLAGRILGPGRPAVETVPVPQPGPGDVLIEVARAGICGTDLHILDGDYELARFPMTPGHEFAGTIAAVGEGVRHRTVGERVTADPNLPCGLCPECQRGAVNQCHDLAVVGVSRDGAFARYVSVPERVVVPIGSLSFAEGALVEPLACVVWGLQRIRPAPGSRALVFGAGPMGCMLIQALAACGVARVAAVDVAPARLDVARRLGAELAVTPDELERVSSVAPLGFELVVEATGVASVLERSVEYARPGGTVWVFGVAPGDALASISPFALFRRDLSLVGSFAVNQTVPPAVTMIEGGAVDVAPLVSHVLPIESFEEGLRLAAHDPDRMKIQFTFGGAGPNP
jgi:D-arabinitol dehydrogenase (NADP+)